MKKLAMRSSLGLESFPEDTGEDATQTTAAGEPVANADGDIEGGAGETVPPTEEGGEAAAATADSGEVIPGAEGEGEGEAAVVAEDQGTDDGAGEDGEATDDVVDADADAGAAPEGGEVIPATDGADAAAEAQAAADEADATAEVIDEARVDGETAEAELAEGDEKDKVIGEIANESLLAIDAAIALESAGEALAAQMRAGTLNRESTVYLMGNVNRAMASINQPVMSSFGLESAEEADEKVGAASGLMGNLKEYAVRIKQAIVDGLKKAISFISERLKNIFTAAARNKERAKKLKTVLSTYAKPFVAVTSPRIAGGIMKGDKESTNLVKDVEEAFKIAHAFSAPGIYAPVEAIANGKDPEAMNSQLKTLRDKWKSAMGGDKVVTLGNMSYELSLPENVDTINTLGAKVVRGDAKSIDTPMRVLAINEANGTVNAVINGLTKLEALRNDPAFKAVEKAVMGNVNKITDKIEDPGTFKKVLNVLLRLVSTTGSLPSTVFAAAAVRQSGYALDWVQASIDGPNLGDRATKAVSDAGTKVSAAVNKAGTAAKSAGNSVASAAKNAGNAVSGAAKAGAKSVASAASAAKSKITGKGA